MSPIKASMSTNKKILTMNEMGQIFGVVEALADMQQRFWKSLEKRLVGWDEKPIKEQSIGDLFYPPNQKVCLLSLCNNEIYFLSCFCTESNYGSLHGVYYQS